MAAHRRNFERLAVGHSIRLAEETQRILDAVTFESRPPCAFPSFVESPADVDRQTEIGLSSAP